MSIGERISELRKQKNLSQGELAQLAFVSRQAVSKWENDESSPDTIHLIQIADILDTEVEYLATGKKPVYEEPPIVVNLVKTPEKIVEKVIEKPIIKHVFHDRIKYVRNPLEYFAVAVFSFLLGLLAGFLL